MSIGKLIVTAVLVAIGLAACGGEAFDTEKYEEVLLSDSELESRLTLRCDYFSNGQFSYRDDYLLHSRIFRKGTDSLWGYRGSHRSESLRTIEVYWPVSSTTRYRSCDLVSMNARPVRKDSAKACPELDLSTLWLPDDKARSKESFLMRASFLNDSGQCVIEAGFGLQDQKYYFTIGDKQDLKNAEIIRFSEGTLRPEN